MIRQTMAGMGSSSGDTEKSCSIEPNCFSYQAQRVWCSHLGGLGIVLSLLEGVLCSEKSKVVECRESELGGTVKDEDPYNS